MNEISQAGVRQPGRHFRNRARVIRIKSRPLMHHVRCTLYARNENRLVRIVVGRVTLVLINTSSNKDSRLLWEIKKIAIALPLSG